MKILLLILDLLALPFNGISQSNLPELSYNVTGVPEKEGFIILRNKKPACYSNCQYEEGYETMLGDGKVKFHQDPINEKIKVEITGMGAEKANMYIFDMQGKFIANSTFSGTEGIIDLSQQPTGMYLMKLYVGGGKKELKIIKCDSPSVNVLFIP